MYIYIYIYAYCNNSFKKQLKTLLFLMCIYSHVCVLWASYGRAFFIEFSLGGNVLKGHSKWLKRAAYALLIIIYITLRNV